MYGLLLFRKGREKFLMKVYEMLENEPIVYGIIDAKNKRKLEVKKKKKERELENITFDPCNSTTSKQNVDSKDCPL